MLGHRSLSSEGFELSTLTGISSCLHADLHRSLPDCSNVSRDSRILQSPVLNGFEDSQFQRVCLRFDFKHDYSREE